MLRRLLLVLSLELAVTTQAASRALIVGVGDYRDSSISDLSSAGIPEDVEMYRDIARFMGIPAANIRVLKDDQATARNIVENLQGWLRAGVQPGDRVFFAYSGHGTYMRDTSGDEADGRDEGLVPHDATVRGRVAVNYLWDDQLRSLLQAIPSEDLYVFIDACHSGTVTRSYWGANDLGVDEVLPRFHQLPADVIDGGIDGVHLPRARSLERLDVPYLSFSAAQDDQYSYGSGAGGIFTLSVYQQFRRMAEQGARYTPVQMMEQAKADIRRWAGSSGKAFEPNVVGPQKRLMSPMPLEGASQQGEGPLWQRLSKLVAAADGPLDVRVNQYSFRVGDVLRVATILPRGGYLNIVSVDARDNATVLYPNAYNEDNYVAAGAVTVPTSEMPFDLVAGEPLGPALLVAILSENPVNLYKLGFGQRGGTDSMPYQTLSMRGLRAFTVSQPQQSQQSRAYWASRIETQVRR